MRDLGSLPRGLQLVNLSSGTSSPNTRDFSSRLAAAADPEYSVPARTCFTWRTGEHLLCDSSILFTRQPYTLFSVTRRSWSDNVSEWVTLRTELTDVTLVSKDTHWRFYWQDSGNDSYGSVVREILVLIMEVDKVADEVTDMEIDK